MNYKGTKDECEQMDRFRYVAEVVRASGDMAVRTPIYKIMENMVNEIASIYNKKFPDGSLERISRGEGRPKVSMNMIMTTGVTMMLNAHAKIDSSIPNGKCLSAAQIYGLLFQNVKGYETLSVKALGKILKDIAYDLGWQPGIDYISRNNMLCYRLSVSGGLGNSGEWVTESDVKEGK